MRALGSPKMPRAVARGRKPGKEYVWANRRRFLPIVPIGT